MLMKNGSKHRISCEALGIKGLNPGETVEVEDGYCSFRTSPNGTSIEAIVEMVCPQLVPADDTLLAAWKARTLDVKVPPPPPPTAGDLEKGGLSPGVAALAAAGEAGTVNRQPKAQPRTPGRG